MRKETGLDVEKSVIWVTIANDQKHGQHTLQ